MVCFIITLNFLKKHLNIVKRKIEIHFNLDSVVNALNVVSSNFYLENRV